MSDLTLICETCRFPIAGDTGCIYVTFREINAARAYERDGTALSEPIRWRVRHYAHPETGETDFYGISSDQIATWPALARWTAHLMEKNWFALTDWDDLLRELSGEMPGRRIRVVAQEAA